MPYAKRASSPAVPKRPSHAPDATLVPPQANVRTFAFAIITTDANELVADIHDRMPVILAQDDYARWLGDEPDPRDLMRPFPVGLMRMWPISTRVNKPENDDPSIVEAIEAAAGVA